MAGASLGSHENTDTIAEAKTFCSAEAQKSNQTHVFETSSLAHNLSDWRVRLRNTCIPGSDRDSCRDEKGQRRNFFEMMLGFSVFIKEERRKDENIFSPDIPFRKKFVNALP